MSGNYEDALASYEPLSPTFWEKRERILKSLCLGDKVTGILEREKAHCVKMAHIWKQRAASFSKQ